MKLSSEHSFAVFSFHPLFWHMRVHMVGGYGCFAFTVSWCLADQRWRNTEQDDALWSFPSCFLWSCQSVTIAWMLNLSMCSAEFWLGFGAPHFRSCINTWQLIGSNLAPSLLPRLARHDNNLMVWHPHPGCSWTHWSQTFSFGAACKKKILPDGVGGSTQHVSFSFHCRDIFIVPMDKADHQVQIQNEILALGLCFSCNLLQAWDIS